VFKIVRYLQSNLLNEASMNHIVDHIVEGSEPEFPVVQMLTQAGQNMEVHQAVYTKASDRFCIQFCRRRDLDFSVC
jgi:hypothetical protein